VLRFTVVTRADCDLCDELLAQLQQFIAGREAAVDVIDVDSDPDLRRRYGHQVPVLLLDDEPVCHGHFDADEVTRLTRPR
jgi:hypothetical protein